MKGGDKTLCPHCGETTIAKTKPKMDGWTRVGDILVCALCGAELGVPDTADGGKSSSASAASSSFSCRFGSSMATV